MARKYNATIALCFSIEEEIGLSLERRIRRGLIDEIQAYAR